MNSPEQEKLEHSGKKLTQSAEKIAESAAESAAEKAGNAEKMAENVKEKVEGAAECALKKGQKIIHDMCAGVTAEAEKLTNHERERLIQDAVQKGCCSAESHSRMQSCGCGCEEDVCICQQVFPWLGFVGITLASGWVSSLFMQPAGHEWFSTLIRPSWAPPQWIFLPVWILLYFLLGTSVWLSWRRLGCKKAAGVLVLYALLLLLQIAWAYTFFYQQNPFGGFIDLIWIFAVLLLLLLGTVPVCRVAAVLLIPQTLWILYALILNYHIWRLN